MRARCPASPVGIRGLDWLVIAKRLWESRRRNKVLPFWYSCLKLDTFHVAWHWENLLLFPLHMPVKRGMNETNRFHFQSKLLCKTRDSWPEFGRTRQFLIYSFLHPGTGPRSCVLPLLTAEWLIWAWTGTTFYNVFWEKRKGTHILKAWSF